MKPDTPLIDFFHRVYASLKLTECDSKASDVKTAIEALTASQGHVATVSDLVRLSTAPRYLGALRAYLVELGVLAVPEPEYRAVLYRGKEVWVSRGDPTPYEIEERAAVIRADWSPKETRKRAGTSKRHWTPPQVVALASED